MSVKCNACDMEWSYTPEPGGAHCPENDRDARLVLRNLDPKI